MSDIDSGDLFDLYEQAKELSEGERGRFLERLHAEGAVEQAEEIRELLAEDEALGGAFSLGLGSTVGAALRQVLSSDQSAESYLEGLEKYASSVPRYERQAEVARGAMGSIVRVVDKPLRRELAMKIALRTEVADGGAIGSLSRFVEEAQITGQLDHPGIVPVHELGVDPDGVPYFTMRMVRGRELSEIYKLARKRVGNWNTTRVLGLLMKVCETMAYAHSKGVIHRDLKPTNIMVGRFGEVYVMDWGLAKVVGQPDRRDLRWKKPVETRPVGSDIRDGSGVAAPSTPLLTMDGAILGTPAYMPPEQGTGQAELLDERADVYAVGSMLYELLVGRPPYVPAEGNITPHTLLASLVMGPPQPVSELAPDSPVELVAICERAMSRGREERYANLRELAEDLSAFLEGRVVRAHESGAWAEARKWIQRNRSVAAILAGAVILSLGSLAGVVAVQARANDKITFEAARARRAEQQAVQRTEDVLMLSAFQRLSELQRQADELWPPEPRHIPSLEGWVLDADALRSRLEALRSNLEAIRSEHSTTSGPKDGSRGSMESISDEFEAEFGWLHAQLAELIAGVEELFDPSIGLASRRGISPAFGWSIPKRLDAARRIARGFEPGGDFALRWTSALASIRADARFDGHEVEPVEILVPIGRDPDSGLWEFWHVPSGSEPTRADDGYLDADPDSGIVLVLLPGGPFTRGSQGSDPQAPNYDPQSRSREELSPQTEVEPFFVSKYEVTQAQWLRITGDNPSRWNNARSLGPGFDDRELLLHPVEEINWYEATAALERFGLQLPTEVLVEFATRGQTSTPWFTGRDKLDLSEVANLADISIFSSLPKDLELDDGFVIHGPVGSMRPNAFGLHDVHGNVREWCRDYEGGAAWVRGGSWQTGAESARSAFRSTEPRAHSFMDLGVRPTLRVNGR